MQGFFRNGQATLVIRAMMNAAKSGGRLDKEEQAKITGNLGKVTQDEIDFINRELERPLDVGRLCRISANQTGQPGVRYVANCH